MPVVKLYSQNGEVLGDFELSKDVFDAPVHVPAMHQVVTAQLANRRLGTACVKTRAEVRGGGKKPWRQKHTGRARHGSIRSPIWVGGGVAFGPRPRSYAQKVNKKVRKLALCSALSLKVKEDNLVVLKDISFEKPSTKAMIACLKSVSESAKKPLLLIAKSDNAVYRSTTNIPGAMVLHIDSINVYDILNHDALIITEGAARKIEEVYGN